jgi:hypothetical protein
LHRRQRALGIGAREPDQALGLRIGERPQQDGGDQAEHHGVAADAQGERQDRHGGEAGLAQEHAAGVADVLPERLQGREAPDVAAGLLGGGPAPEAADRRLARRHGVHPSGRVLRLAHREVEAQLVVEVLLQAPAPEQGRETPPGRVDPLAEARARHAVPMTRAIPALIRSQ